MVKIRGITWNHTRGYIPLVAAAQRFNELNPGIEIEWSKRSLQEFADYPLDKLIDRFDLLVIDHPWAGAAVDKNLLCDLNDYLPANFLDSQKGHSVGASHESYNIDGVQCALAIDAAAPVASYRGDVFTRLGLRLPENWGDLLALAEKGIVIFPGIPIDSLMNFYMMCSSHGEDPFQQDDLVVSKDIGAMGLEQLRELASLCPDIIYDCNPIKVYEAMANGEGFGYCPFAYGYSNYSREGYSKHLLMFCNPVRMGAKPLRTTLGGTGIAMSAHSASKNVAAEFLQFVANADFQRTLYSVNGGQPAHRLAWVDESVNRQTHGFFQNTVQALDGSFMRPRYPGYLHFQDNAGSVVQNYMRSGGNASKTLEQLNHLYRESRNLL